MTANHVDTVLNALHSPDTAGLSAVKASWIRSALYHGLDPATKGQRERVSEGRLSELRDAHAPFLSAARTTLDEISVLVSRSGCGVALTSAEGIVLESRVAASDRDLFSSSGLVEGGQWSEALEGTNGIGTCLQEARPLIIHKGQHFYQRNIGISCIDAPIFDPHGRLVGAIDVTSCRADHGPAMIEMIGGLVREAARRVERAYFCQHFVGSRVIFLDEASIGTELLAVDADDLVIGASRAARIRLEITDQMIARPQPAVQLIGSDQSLSFDDSQQRVIRQALAKAGGNATKAARQLGVSRATFYRRMRHGRSCQ
ncbi:GAF domain-containing protein [Sphingobium sp. AN641]|uniref:GAF domain-containing protein n=1 Tax=Sphingobium sp. AN641 TaxID=3133443 RepID=UPI0030BFA484